MREQAEKLKVIAEELSQSKGPFELFALFLREDAPNNRWDLIISSDWAREDKRTTIELLVEKIKEVFNDEEMLMLSRIVILGKDDDALKAFHRTKAMHIKFGMNEIKDSKFFGLQIKHAYLIMA